MRCIASRAIRAPLLPWSASGSSWLRRADIAANSAPTKKALAPSSTTVMRTVEHAHRSHLAVGAVGVVRGPARRSPAGAGRRLEADPVDPVAVHVDDPGGPAVDRGRRHRRPAPGRGRHDPAADRLVGGAVGDGDADPGAHLVGAPQAGDGPRAVAQRAPGGLRAVVLVVDLADDLLDEVLEGDDARGAAVLVDDDGELHPALAQLEQQRVEAQRLGHEDRGHHQRRHRHVAAAVEGDGDRLLDVDDAVDVVPVVADDGEARVPGAPRERPRGRRRSRCGRSRWRASAGS